MHTCNITQTELVVFMHLGCTQVHTHKKEDQRKEKEPMNFKASREGLKGEMGREGNEVIIL